MAIEDTLRDMQKQITDLQEQLTGLRKIEKGGVWLSWTPTWTGLTVTGSPIMDGKYNVLGKMCFFNVIINPNGGTTASTAGSTYINNPPIASVRDCNFLISALANAGVNNGVGNMWQNKMYTISWSAYSGWMLFQGCYQIA